MPEGVEGVLAEAPAVEGAEAVEGTQDFLRFLGKTGKGITCKNKRSLESLF